MKTSEKTIEIIKGLGSFQKDCPTIAKNAKGYGYKYASFDSILDTVKPLLLKNGIVFTQTVGMCEHGNTLTTRLTHVSGEYIEDTMVLPKLAEQKNMNAVQSMGAVITYVKRYQLSAMLGIATDEDSDGIQQNQTQGGNNGIRH